MGKIDSRNINNSSLSSNKLNYVDSHNLRDRSGKNIVK
jgi:hypothetical protein